jgi:peptidase C13-like protein
MNTASAFGAGLLQNLRAGLRLALLRRVERQSFSVTVEQFVALVLIYLLLGFLSDLAEYGFDGRFNPWGLPGALFYLPPLLLAAYIVSRRAQDAALALLLPVAVLAVGEWIAMVSAVLGLLLDFGWIDLPESELVFLLAVPPLWWLLAAGFAALRLTCGGLRGRLLEAGIVVVLISIPLVLLPRPSIAPLWIANDTGWLGGAPGTQSYALASEAAFYAQPDILRRNLAALRPGRRGIEEIYFVGVAGYAAEDVFRDELRVVKRLFDRRFDTLGRSISLINNPGTTLQSPIASVTSLERTLTRVGRVMNRDEDVLFLYLTSHGSDDHRFALEFWPLHLRDLEPAVLRAMLDRAGIRWRIVVVSACYAGGFIEPLKDERTLIITAADAHHTSFGCGAKADFTYFGKAYFDQALRTTYSFTAAFDAARRSIEAREQAEGRTRSNPQMYVGPEMVRKLQRLEARWGDGQS